MMPPPFAHNHIHSAGQVRRPMNHRLDFLRMRRTGQQHGHNHQLVIFVTAGDVPQDVRNARHRVEVRQMRLDAGALDVDLQAPDVFGQGIVVRTVVVERVVVVLDTGVKGVPGEEGWDIPGRRDLHLMRNLVAVEIGPDRGHRASGRRRPPRPLLPEAPSRQCWCPQCWMTLTLQGL